MTSAVPVKGLNQITKVPYKWTSISDASKETGVSTTEISRRIQEQDFTMIAGWSFKNDRIRRELPHYGYNEAVLSRQQQVVKQVTKVSRNVKQRIPDLSKVKVSKGY